nr:transposase family protein [Ktedonobacter racemifer]
MKNALLLPDPDVLVLLDIEIETSSQTITARAQTSSSQARCPLCQHFSHRVQSHYSRMFADLPCSGHQVRWLIQVRRLWCDNGMCELKIFTGRLPTCAPAYARRTVQQATTLCEVAFVLGGRLVNEWLCCKKGRRSGTVKENERKRSPYGRATPLQMASLPTRHHPLVREVVSPLCVELPRS